MKYLLTLLTISLICAPARLSSQTAPLQTDRHPYHIDSGIHDGTEAGRPVLAFYEVVQIPRAPWLRLTFSDAFLGSESYLILRSLLDGGTQRLDAVTLEQWQNTSAYFNGDAVEIQLYVGAGDEGIFVRTDEVFAGQWMPGDVPESQCGPNDDRVPSSDPAAARLLDIGCTAWIICDGRLITAGHCSSSPSLLDLVEFNVPASMPNGTIVHPGPEDQYVVNAGTVVFVNGGVGNDWGVFEVFANSVTGMMPIDAQGSHFELVQSLTPSTIRITGFGVDFNNGDRNQTQQTHAGPNAGSSGTTMRYQTDTEGGNSGSPVIDDATGNAVGVHTHGGCTTGGSGNNSGTSLFNTAFWAEVGNLNCGGGGGIPCSDIRRMSALCRTNGRIRVTVVLTSTAHDGETVQVTVDSDTYTGTIASGRAVIVTATSYPAGPHTVTLTDPAGCTNIAPVTVTCGTNKADFELTENEITSEVPIATEVLGNFPNPFNPSTTISYAISEPTWVTLKVYNTLGQEVATIVDARQSAGYASATWNGTNDAGEAVSSGIYIYRMVAGDLVKTGRMLLMK
jgi:hypothetical protein